ncbi:uncharacterized protein Hap1MRO34_013261 isoform 1-T2 [Clarias gariepinus]
METVRKNKPFLINTLSTDASTVLQHVQSDDVILQRDYDDLKQPNHTGRTIITNLLDILMRRGDETCRKFLKVLEKKELQDNFPQLKDLFTPEQPSAERARESTGAEFVDEHREQLIQRVSSVMEIADCLLTKKIITGEIYNNVSAASTSQEKMRILYKSLNSKIVKEEFYKILKEKQRFLVADLEG